MRHLKVLGEEGNEVLDLVYGEMKKIGELSLLAAKEAGRRIGKTIQCGGVGCNGCCYQMVIIPLHDGLVIARELKASGKDTPELRARLGEAARGMLVSERGEWFKKEKPCVFLGEDGGCDIHEVRPTSCRSYFVYTDPKGCYPASESNIVSHWDNRVAVKAEIDVMEKFANASQIEASIGVLPSSVLAGLKLLDGEEIGEWYWLKPDSPVMRG